jgi:molecular chaperone GrpE
MKEKNINIENGEILNEQEIEEQVEATVQSTEESKKEQEDSAESSCSQSEEQLTAQIEELKDKYLRSVAEFDNYRKRTLKERAELIINGGEKVISAILPVVDDMERAIENGAKTDDSQVLREGMELIYSKLMKVLKDQGVSTIDTVDADFDTDVHEAVAMVPATDDNKKGKVIDCLSKGYKLNEKVIRHAKVAVGN